MLDRTFRSLLSSRSLGLAAAVTLAATVGAAGCGEEGKATGSTCPPGSTLTYANFGQALVQNNCLRCHSTKESPTLTSQAAIKANAAEIDKQAAAGPNATNTSMPDDGSLSDDDRKKLGEWLACGAP